jgi:hypothetical protein
VRQDVSQQLEILDHAGEDLTTKHTEHTKENPSPFSSNPLKIEDENEEEDDGPALPHHHDQNSTRR